MKTPQLIALIVTALVLLLAAAPITKFVKQQMADNAIDRGIALEKSGQNDAALQQLTKATQLCPQYYRGWRVRGQILYRMKNYDEAIRNCTSAIEHVEGSGLIGRQFHRDGFTSARGQIYLRKGEYAKGVADLESVFTNDPNFHGGGENALAWALATCPDASIRNGRRAVQYALSACEYYTKCADMTGKPKQSASYLDTLAAAYAESGNFPEAIRWQQQAIGLNTNPATQAEFTARLQLYRSGQPYHETAKP